MSDAGWVQGPTDGDRIQSRAPGFGADADEMTAAELFWVTKNGSRFTAMPAWGPSHSDQDLRDVVAFVLTLPKLNAAEYDAIDRRVPLESKPTQ